MVLHHPLLSPLEVVFGNEEAVLGGDERPSWEPIDLENAQGVVGTGITGVDRAVVGIVAKVEGIDEFITEIHRTLGILLGILPEQDMDMV